MTFHRTRAVLVALALLVQPVPALASTILGGNDVIARPYLDGADGVLFFDLNGRISGNGEIDSWSIYANATGGEVKLLIYRDNGANWDFVGESGLEAVNSLGVNTFALASPITVETDDIIAWWYPEPTQPSIAFSDGGETINNHDWPWEPITQARLDGEFKGSIDDLNGGAFFAGTVWDTNPRTYSIQVSGTLVIPEPAPLATLLAGLMGLYRVRRNRLRQV